jgi:hypothetical protein
MISKILWAIYLISLSFMLGGIAFLSFFVAPIVFQNFSNEEAGNIMNTIFPGYHMLKSACGFLAAGCLIFLGFLERKWPVIRLTSIGVVLALNLYSGLVAGPQASKIRDQINQQKAKGVLSQELKEQFNQIHKKAVFLNGSVLLVGLGLLLEAGFRIRS